MLIYKNIILKINFLKMIPEHILSSDLYKQLCEDYDENMSF